MAQPLAKPEEPATSGIDDAAWRLEEAFRRLEAAVARTQAGVHSVKAENEKLNGLLHEAEGEIGRLREVVYTVSDRLDRTIHALEAMEE